MCFICLSLNLHLTQERQYYIEQCSKQMELLEPIRKGDLQGVQAAYKPYGVLDILVLIIFSEIQLLQLVFSSYTYVRSISWGSGVEFAVLYLQQQYYLDCAIKVKLKTGKSSMVWLLPSMAVQGIVYVMLVVVFSVQNVLVNMTA